jgi:hypothetical protein
VSAGLVWRADARGGVAHACHEGYATTLCGTQARHEVTRGALCPRCLELATEHVLRHG